MSTASHHVTRLLALGVLLAPCYAFAVLGGAPLNVTADQSRSLVPSIKSTVSGAYTVQESVDSSGTHLREYVSNAGLVFAIAWQGPHIPDLRTQLGQYFSTLQSAAKVPHTARSNTLVSTSDLVVQSGGLPRAFVGRAWLPAQLPAGVTAQNIQ